MALIAILQPDARVAARLTEQVAPPHRVELTTSWSDLERMLAQGAADGCVVDLDYPARDEAMDRVAGLRARFPEAAVVAYGDFRNQSLELFRLGSLGVDGVLSAGARTGPAMREVVELALASARGRSVAAALPDAAPADAGKALAWATEHAGSRPAVAELARAFGCSEGSLRTRLGEAGLPTPSRVLLWGRLLQAGSLLERDHRTVEETAYALGYTTASALTRAMKRETGLTPTEVARRGGARRVLRVLIET